MIELEQGSGADTASDDAESGAGESDSLVGHSLTGSIWTLISRITGLARILVVGAVLGATYLGNTYQGMNALPNLVYYQILAGSLFVSLLVPPLMRHIREGDEERSDALVRGFLGGVLGLGLVAMAVLMVAAPAIVHVFSLGVADPHSAAGQRRIGLELLLLFAPQIPLYVIAGTGAAVMNAHGRYALASGAPTVENLGIIVTLLALAATFGTAATLSSIGTPEVVLLGAGTTAAVALHATTQWLGARRDRPRMRPGFWFGDPEVRTVLGRIRSILAYTGLATLQLVAMLVVSNRLSGGLVTFQLALNFFYLPTAIVTWPVARAFIPRLSSLHQTEQPQAFREQLARAMALAGFITIPVAAAYAVSAPQVADLVAFGRLATPHATEYVAVALIALCPAVIGETGFILGTYALYAQENVRAPLRSMAVRVATTLGLLIPATMAHGPLVLLLIGVAFSIGSFAGALHAWHAVSGESRAPGPSLVRPLARTMLASIAMIVPAALVWKASGLLAGTRAGDAVHLGLAAVAATAAYVAIQIRFRAPEIALLRRSMRRAARLEGAR